MDLVVWAVCDSFRTVPSGVLHLLFEDAAIHHDFNPCRSGSLRGTFVDYAFLHPDDFGASTNGGFNDIRHEF